MNPSTSSDLIFRLAYSFEAAANGYPECRLNPGLNKTLYPEPPLNFSLESSDLMLVVKTLTESFEMGNDYRQGSRLAVVRELHMFFCSDE